LSWIGLIMAGGDGTRMAQSGIQVRKPLAPALGVTLIERNLWMLARAGCREIAIATSARAAVEEKPFTDDLARRAASIGLVVELLVEERPLGNFGAVTRLSGRDKPVVVVFADNLTTLDLGDLVRNHSQSKAALTLAAHNELFRMPYGELRVRPDDTSRLLNYVEKPSYDILISSGIAVISDAALSLLLRETALGLSTVSNILIEGGLSVHIHRHACPWVDANDRNGLRAAAALVQRERAILESWWPGTLKDEGILALGSADGLLTPREWFTGISISEYPSKPIWTFDALTAGGVVRVHATLSESRVGGGHPLPSDIAGPIAARLRATSPVAQVGS
jgi:NDP-sugar pyrophosphorylase family protein